MPYWPHPGPAAPVLSSSSVVIGNSSITLTFSPGSPYTYAYSIYGTKLTGSRDIGAGNYSLVAGPIKGSSMEPAGKGLARSCP